MSDSNRAAQAAQWWRRMQPNFENGSRNPFGDRAGLARLRRCATITEAMQEAATIELFRALKLHDVAQLEDVALAAGVLATVRTAEVGGQSFPRAIGPDSPDKPETAIMKPIRFRRLMEAETPTERLTVYRRAVALAGYTANLHSLAEALLGWNDGLRTRWIFDYWNAADRPATALTNT